MWHELDSMTTNDVTSLYLILVDDGVDMLHAIVRKKFMWNFEPLLQEGMLLSFNNMELYPEKKMLRPAMNDKHDYFYWNSDIVHLRTIPRHKFNFTEFENLRASSDNIYLIDVVGILTSHTKWQQLKHTTDNACLMREIMLEDLSGMKLKLTLWGDSTAELTRNLKAHGINPILVVVLAGVYVKQYQGYSPVDPSVAKDRKTMAQLMETKWEFGYNVLNKKVFQVKFVRIDTTKGWYIGCNNCTTKLVGDTGDHWCLRCTFCAWRLKILLGVFFFVATDAEVQELIQASVFDLLAKGEDDLTKVMAAFKPLMHALQDYIIVVTPYNTNNPSTRSFTVAKLFAVTLAPSPPVPSMITKIVRPSDDNVIMDEPVRKNRVSSRTWAETKNPSLQKNSSYGEIVLCWV